MHPICLGRLELSSQDEDRYKLPDKQLVLQVLQLQSKVRPIPDLPFEQVEFDRTRQLLWKSQVETTP